MKNFNVIYEGSQRDVLVGVIEAIDAEDAGEIVARDYADPDSSDMSFSDFRVEECV